MPIYKLNGESYTIPDELAKDFESNPDHASATVSVTNEGKNLDIPLELKDQFFNKFQGASYYAEQEPAYQEPSQQEPQQAQIQAPQQPMNTSRLDPKYQLDEDGSVKPYNLLEQEKTVDDNGNTQWKPKLVKGADGTDVYRNAMTGEEYNPLSPEAIGNVDQNRMDPHKYADKTIDPSWGETFGKSLGAGFTRAGAGLIDVLQQLSSGMYVESGDGYIRTPSYEEARKNKNNALTKASDVMHETADRMSREAQPYGGEKGFLDLFWDGEISKLAQKGLATAGESLPMTISAYNPYTMVLNAISMAGSNYRDETLENPEIPAWKRASYAIGQAAIEQAVEKYADPVFKYIGGSKGKEVAKDVTKQATESIAQRIYNALGGWAKDAAGEGVEEVATNFGNDALGEALDAIDMLEGGGRDYGIRAQWEKMKKENPDANLSDFAKAKAKENVEAFIGGALAGAYTSGTAQVSTGALRYLVARGTNQDVPDGVKLDPVTVEVAQAYDNGQSLEAPQDKNDAKVMYDVQREKMLEIANESYIQWLDENPLEGLREAMTREDFTAKQKQGILDYVNAKATYDGMIQKVRDDIDNQVAESDASIDGRIYRAEGDKKGMIVPATMKKDNRQVYVIDGDIQMSDDGSSVDVSKSSDTIIIKDAETGKLEFVSPHDFQNVGEALDAETEKATQREAITQQTAQEQAKQMEGVLPFNVGDVYAIQDEQGNKNQVNVLADNGDGTVIVSVNGSAAQPFSKDELQRLSDLESRGRAVEKVAQKDAEDAAEANGAEAEAVSQPAVEAVAQPVAPVAETAEGVQNTGENEINGGESVQQTGETVQPTAESVQSEPMPMIGEGDDAEPNFLATTPERGLSFLFGESQWDESDADDFLNSNVNASAKEVEKIEGKRPKAGTNFAKFNKDMAAWNASKQEAEAKAKYWKQMKELRDAELAKQKAERDAAEKARQEAATDQAIAEEAAYAAEQAQKAAEQAELGSNNVAPAIREKWAAVPKTEGVADEIVLANGEKVAGKYYLVESGAASASHDANNGFVKTEGFPVDENGNSVNDRDYERDQDAQRVTRQIADNYDSRALQTPVVVSQDGVVLSGNGRTMAGELAASNNTDGAYVDYLKNYGQRWGFTSEQVGGMQHPRVVFVPDAAMPYTAETFAKFNQQEMKGQNKTEQAVKLGKVVDDATFGRIITSINRFERMSDFYADAKAATEAIGELQKAGAISQAQVAEMYDGDGISAIGRELLENMLVGKAFENNPDAVREITAFRSVRQTVIKALGEILNNVKLGEDYSLEEELAGAIDLVYKARKEGGYKEGERVSGFARQMNLGFFGEDMTVADMNNVTMLEIADILNSGFESRLKVYMQDYNAHAQESAAGQLDLFSGEVMSKEDILNDVNNLFNNGTEQETADTRAEGVAEDGAVNNGGAESAEASAVTTGNAAEAIAAAEAETDTNPSEAQKEAGNYKKGHVKVDGYDITIENPKGSVRSGKDADGKEWSVTMNNTYGYIRGTEGVDGDHIDVFLSDNPEQGNVYVVDQVDADGNFDEHKVMYGFGSAEEARDNYLANYSDGWKMGTITEVSKEEFKKWIESSHRKTKPFSEYKSVKKEGAQGEAQQPSTSAEEKETNVDKAIRIMKEIDDLSSELDELYTTGPEAEADRVSAEHMAKYGELEALEKSMTDEEKEALDKRLRDEVDDLDGEWAEWLEAGMKEEPVESTHNLNNAEAEKNQKPEKPQKTSQRKPRKTKPSTTTAGDEKINDVGEKIGGARKDATLNYAKKIDLEATVPSKIFPKPNFASMEKAGVPHETLVKLKAYYTAFSIINKNKRKRNENQRILSARFYASVARDMLLRDVDVFNESADGIVLTDYGKQHLELLVSCVEALDKKGVPGFFDLDISDVDINIGEFKENENGAYQTKDGKRWVGTYSYGRTNNMAAVRYKLFALDDIEGLAEEYCKQVEEAHSKNVQNEIKIHVYRMSSGKCYISAKVKGIADEIKLKDDFSSSKEAFDYIRENGDALRTEARAKADEMKQSKRNGGGTRKPTNDDIERMLRNIVQGTRIGKDYRNGKDVSAEDFMKEFGFRGVEFGNWATQKERQDHLNACYDALMDLADLVGISPKAISLGGKLAMAFGSRGHSSALAHYEPAKHVINLTKEHGAGCVAHEWFHAIDNYFGGGVFGLRMKSAVEGNSRDNLRSEMQKIFAEIGRALNGSDMKVRSKKLGNGDYWASTLEMAARAFESYVNERLMARGQMNQYLSAHVPGEAVQYEELAKNDPYPTAEESKKFGEIFDRLFDTVQEEVGDDGNVNLFQIADVEPGTENVTEAQQLATEAIITALGENAGLDVVMESQEKGQRVSAERNDGVEMMAGRVSSRRKQIASDVDLSSLTDMQKSIVEAYTDESSDVVVSFSDATGKKRSIRMEQGSEQKRGVKHSLFRHYGMSRNNLTSQDILLAEEVLKTGTRSVNGNKVDYVKVINGVKYTIATQTKGKDGQESFVNYYTDRFEPSSQQGTQNTNNTLAQATMAQNLGANVENNSDTTKSSAENLRNSPEFMQVWHGSAAVFDHFDGAFMGSGEGSQVYGDGHYVTGVESTGRMYATIATEDRQRSNTPIVRWKGQQVDFSSVNPLRLAHDVADSSRTIKEARDRAERYADMAEEDDMKTNWALALDILKQSTKADFKPVPVNGNRQLYEVEIPDDNGKNYIDWNKEYTRAELEELGEKLNAIGNPKFDYGRYQEILDIYFDEDGKPQQYRVFTGEQIYRSLATNLAGGMSMDKKTASEMLSKVGIVGIKVPTGNRRGGDGRGTNYVIFNDNDLKITDRVQFMQRPEGTVYGWSEGNRIHLTPDGINPNTPIHEYTHLWARAVMQKNPKLWNRIKELLQGTPIWDEVVNDPAYQGLTSDDAIASEALSRLSGRKNAGKMEKMAQDLLNEAKGNGVFAEANAHTLILKMKQALKDFWKWVGTNLFDMTDVKNIDEVTDRVLYDLLNKTDLALSEDGDVATEFQVVADGQSATENNSEFDAANPDIRFRERTEFDDGEVIDIVGNRGSQDYSLADSTMPSYNSKEEHPAYAAVLTADGNGIEVTAWKSVLDERVRKPLRRNGEPTKAEKQRAAYVERKTQIAIANVNEKAQKLGLNVEVITDTEGLPKNMADKKGWYNKVTGKITIVLPNHSNGQDVMRTLMHEGVAHHGLRQMFGKDFDTFLNNVYANADIEVRRRIAELAAKKGWDFHVATEEYLAALAEDIDFERKVDQTWWQKVKFFFVDMLRKAGIVLDDKLTDNDLRYIVWKSYERMAYAGEYGAIRDARTVMMDQQLGTGNFGTRAVADGSQVADGSELLYRDGEDESEDSTPLSLNESMIQGLINLAEKNKENAAYKTYVVNAIGGELAKLRKAMSAQKEYDRSTVEQMTGLARLLIKNGMFGNISEQEMLRLLTTIKNATGRNDITKYAQQIYDLMIKNQLEQARNMLDRVTRIKDSKVNAQGVEVQGQLDVRGQNLIKAFRKAMSLDEANISELLQNASDRMDSTDAAVADEAATEYAALTLAMQYVHDIKDSVADERVAKEELAQARKDHAAKTDGLSAKAFKEYVQEAEDAIRQKQLERIEAFHNLAARLAGAMQGSIESAKQFRERELERVKNIHHFANSDMQGRPANAHRVDNWKQKVMNNPFLRFLFNPLGTFDQMLRMIGNKSVNGEGYLYNHFMRGWLDATQKEFENYHAACKVLDDKASEVFGKKMRWSDLYSEERNMPKAQISFIDVDGSERTVELNQGNLLYIYMANKMADGRMKLRAMGIMEEDIENIKQVLEPRFVKLADWLQEEFLVNKRNDYNAVHERMFGAPMAAIENYFPLRILGDARVQQVDVAEDKVENELPSILTGSIIKRKTNKNPLDVMNTDAFSVVVEHLQQMEKWAAFAEWRRDLNTLLSYKRFRNQLKNMSSVYGAGNTLWRNFMIAGSIAAGTHRPKVDYDGVDTAMVNLAKGVTTAKIAFRVFTAIKQLLSAPAFMAESSLLNLGKSIATPWKAWNWAMEELPTFKKRWQSKQAGDTRLMKTDVDLSFWKNRLVDTLSRWGMSPNAFVDAMTVAIGGRAIYETKRARYIEDGYSEAEADKKAKQDAAVLVNQTQQSSETAFVSKMQLDRTVAAVSLSVFRNSSMSYQRQLVDAIRGLKRMATPGYKEESINFMAKQMVRDGLDEDAAKRAATRAYNREWVRNLSRTALFGFGMQMAWNLGAYLPYLIFGDDDDEKKEMLEDAAMHGLFGSIEGLSGGNMISELGNMKVKGESFRNYDMYLLPLMSDIKNIYTKFESDEIAAVNDMVNLLIQSGFGVNPQTITDAIVAITDACNGDVETGREATILFLRLAQAPQSQIDKLYIDEVGMRGDEASKLSVQQLAERYADYKKKRGAPLTQWAYSDEQEKAVEDKYIKKFEKQAKERLMQTTGDAKLDDAYEAYEENYKDVKKRLEAVNKLKDEDFTEFYTRMGELASTPEFTKYNAFKGYKTVMDNLMKSVINAKNSDEREGYLRMIEERKRQLVEMLDSIK